MENPQQALVRRALGEDRAALRELVELITPSIHVNVADTLRRRVRADGRSRARHEVEDLTQEVLAALFADQGRRLRLWDPARGLSLPRFVGLVSRHLVESFLRRRDHRVWEDKPIDGDEADVLPDPAESPERFAERKEELYAVLAGVELALTPEAREVFQLLVIEGRPVEEVATATGATPTAIHVKKHRFVKLARDIARRIHGGAVADDGPA
jgi:RNA polymerase sigma factor (sigma-70 family)